MTRGTYGGSTTFRGSRGSRYTNNFRKWQETEVPDNTTIPKRLLMKVYINGHEYLGLLDTGSESCIVSMGLIKKNNLEQRLIPYYAELQTFGESIIATKNKIEMPIEIEGEYREYIIDMIVEPSEREHLVIGQNFLRKYNLNIDYGYTNKEVKVLKTSKYATGNQIETKLYTDKDERRMIKFRRMTNSRYSAPYVKLIIDNTAVDGLIDTGSMQNVIEIETLRYISKEKIIDRSVKINLIGARDIIQTLGEVELEVEMMTIEGNTYKARVRFKVVEKAGERITLGLPFLLGRKILLDNGRNALCTKYIKENNLNVETDTLIRPRWRPKDCNNHCKNYNMHCISEDPIKY